MSIVVVKTIKRPTAERVQPAPIYLVRFPNEDIHVSRGTRLGEQLLAGCGGLSLVHHGDDGDAQVLRRLK